MKNTVSTLMLLVWLYANAFAQDIDIPNIPESLYKNAHAIILEERQVLETLNKKEYTIQTSRKTLVLDKRGAGFLNLHLLYQGNSDKIKNISLQYYDQKGKLIEKVKEKELQDVSGNDGYSLITDVRYKMFNYQALRYPCIVEISYEKKSDNTFHLPMWHPIPNYNVSVLKSTYEIKTSLPVRTKQLNTENFNIITRPAYFELSNQPAIPKEKYEPGAWSFFPFVFLSLQEFSYHGIEGVVKNWQDLTSWYYENLLNPLELIDVQNIKEELQGIISEGDSQYEIARKLYKFLQENTRYVSISLQEGGLKPMSPQKVHEVKYGDCKALSFYLLALLRVYDIDADYVGVHANAKNPVDLIDDFPHTIPGNHAILRIKTPQDTFWVDCTSSVAPFNYLGRFTNNRKVICLAPESDTLIRTPSFSWDENVLKERLLVPALDDSKIINVEMTQEASGLMTDEYWYYSTLSDIEKKEIFKESLESQFKHIDIQKVEIEADEKKVKTICNLQMEVDPIWEKLPGYHLLNHAFSPNTIPRLPRDKDRFAPIHFEIPFTSEQELVILLKNGQYLEKEVDVILESEFGYYTIKTSMDTTGNKINLIVRKQFILKENNFKADKYNELKLFFDKCLLEEKKQLIIKNP